LSTSPHPAPIRIASLTSLADFDRCAALQDEVWSYEPSDRMSQKVFLLASRIGGQVLGAFDGETLVGYSMSLPAHRNAHLYLHSHHLAVLPPWRNAGVGRRLKLAQREDALARGIELIEWTFDPLEIRNAHLNIAKLGAISRRYTRNFYGASSSPLQGGLPTDRIYAEWWLSSHRVQQALRGEAPEITFMQTVSVPAEIYAWKADPAHREEALAVQSRNALALETAFANGLAIIGYQRTERGDGLFQLGTFNEPFCY
jgi:predicted GNAT superfamily acetyltransferase